MPLSGKLISYTGLIQFDIDSCQPYREPTSEPGRTKRYTRSNEHGDAAPTGGRVKIKRGGGEGTNDALGHGEAEK